MTNANVSAWNQVINDLLDPTGQNLRVREDAQVPNFILFSLGYIKAFLHRFSHLHDIGPSTLRHWFCCVNIKFIADPEVSNSLSLALIILPQPLLVNGVMLVVTEFQKQL